MRRGEALDLGGLEFAGSQRSQYPLIKDFRDIGISEFRYPKRRSIQIVPTLRSKVYPKPLTLKPTALYPKP